MSNKATGTDEPIHLFSVNLGGPPPTEEFWDQLIEQDREELKPKPSSGGISYWDLMMQEDELEARRLEGPMSGPGAAVDISTPR
eukprot:14673956-Heterocapsa_arctica.AAC.1